MESKVKNYRSIKITVALIIAFILSICIANISNATVDTTIGDYDGPVKTLRYSRDGNRLNLAYWDNSNNMPSQSYGLTGMLPQYYDSSLSGTDSLIYDSIGSNNPDMREVKLEKSRYNLQTVEWKGTIENGLIYCAKLGGWVRYGHTDFGNGHYITSTMTLGRNGTYYRLIESNQTILSKVTNAAEGYATSTSGYTNSNSETYHSAYQSALADCDQQYRTEEGGGYPHWVGYTIRDSNGNVRVTTTSHSNTINGVSAANVNAYGEIIGIADYAVSQGIPTRMDESGVEDDLDENIGTVVNKLFTDLDETLYGRRRNPNDPNLDSENGVSSVDEVENTSTIYGPWIYVQHQSTAEEDDVGDIANGYEISSDVTTYTSRDNSSDIALRKINLKKAYIFTVMENAYHWDNSTNSWLANENIATSYYDNQPNLRIASKYSVNDIQTAYWWVLKEEGQNIGNVETSDHVTTLGEELYERAGEYADFVCSHDLENFEQYVTIDGTYARMILNSVTGTYSVGPFTIDYPYYEDNPDISYLKAIQIKTNTGATLTYSEDKKDFSIIMDEGDTVNNSNGLQTKFPKPGSSFMVSFSASSANNPTSCTVSAECEYLALSEIDTKSVTSEIDMFRYMYRGYYTTKGYIKITYKYTIKYDHEVNDYTWDPVTQANVITGSHTETETEDETYDRYIYFTQPFILMEENDDPPHVIGQNHTLTENGARIYKTVTVEATPRKMPKQEYVDFPGTKKWADNFNELNIRPKSITVRLYRNGVEINKDEINQEDDNWVYSFKTDRDGNKLPKYQYEDGDVEKVKLDEDGNPIEFRYEVKEDEINGYTPKSIGNDIINTIDITQEYLKVPVKKIWDDADNHFNMRPTSITMHLMRTSFDGTVEEINSVVLNSGNNWEYTFETDRNGNKLPKYEIITTNGSIEYIEYKYTIKEENIDNYNTSINRYETTDAITGETIIGFEITNTWGTFPLSIELGGFVWVDEDRGKEDVYNGIYDDATGGSEHAEARVQNITVRIYRQDGGDMQNGQKYLVTKTDEFGQYRFQGLNAMYKYRIEFDYNGQYYEATTYTSPYDSTNGWGKGNWEVNSNALEKMDKRVELNEKFAQIGSYSENYTNSNGEKKPTYTREILLENDVIDAHGNLTENAKTSTDEKIKNMVDFVKNCGITAYTDYSVNTGIISAYPVSNFFEGMDFMDYINLYLSRTDIRYDQFRALESLIEGELSAIYPDAYCINLGLHPRAITDISVNKDIEKVTLEINNHVQEYTYDNLKLESFKCNNCGFTGKASEFDKTRTGIIVYKKCPECGSTDIQANWDIDINVRISDGYYNTQYTRELYKSDYMYKASMYGEMRDTVGAKKSDELEVYVTYKIAVSNQSLSIKTRIDELVDYYDEDYTIVPERSYIEIEGQKYDIVFSDNSKCGPQTSLTNFKRIYIRGIGAYDQDEANAIYLGSGDYAYFYVTFRVNKDTVNNEDWLRIDEDLNDSTVEFTGKENIVELNGYSTIYEDGVKVPNGEITFNENGIAQIPTETDVSNTPAGIIDINSTPGNFDQTALDEFNKYSSGAPDENGLHKKLGVLENDTDKAPNIKLLLYKEDDANRVISGTVWEDARTETSSNAKVADGKMQDSETKIDGVTVQLVELRENGTEFVWREFGSTTTGVGTIGTGTGSGTKDAETPIINATRANGTNLVNNYTFGEEHKGQYAFKSFIPGNYVVRFIYGDTIRTVAPNALNLGGLNDKSYNGQDYKSTTYQRDITQNRTYEWKTAHSYENGIEKEGKLLTIVSTFKADSSNNEKVKLPDTTVANWEPITVDAQKGYLYDITASDALTNVSDAKDIESIRNAVNNYSNAVENGIEKGVKNYIAEVLASHKSDYTPEYYDRSQLLNDLMYNTKMTAETGLMVIEFEYDTRTTGDQSVNNSTSYKIENVNLGLEERPKAQLALNKDITNVKVTLANGSILFDAKQKASNVLWSDHGKYNTGYEENDVIMYAKDKIMNGHINSLGLIQLTMDEEIMHGATIKIDYNLTVENAGEVDYYEEIDNKEIQDRAFYYTGVPSSNAQIVTTRADEVLDYVANNLQFYKVDNERYWTVKSNETIKSEGLVNPEIAETDKRLALYNTIISTGELNEDLVPEIYKQGVSTAANSSVTVPLTLSQLITSENDTDDLTYKNIAEIVRTSNTVGRRMEYSVVGNQDPTEEPQEIDTDRAEVVKILPPFGETPIYLIISITAIVSIGIIAIGIIFIKKKIIK